MLKCEDWLRHETAVSTRQNLCQRRPLKPDASPQLQLICVHETWMQPQLSCPSRSRTQHYSSEPDALSASETSGATPPRYASATRNLAATRSLARQAWPRSGTMGGPSDPAHSCKCPSTDCGSDPADNFGGHITRRPEALATMLPCTSKSHGTQMATRQRRGCDMYRDTARQMLSTKAVLTAGPHEGDCTPGLVQTGL